MKKIKKTLAVLTLASLVGIGATEISAIQASACPNYINHTYTKDFGFNQYPKIQFSTAMKNQFSGHVWNIQYILNKIGYPCTIDGYYGENTANAVRKFQCDHGFISDRIVGIDTWTSLKNHLR